MEGMTKEDQILGQDDIDALLVRADGTDENRPLKDLKNAEEVSDAYIHALSAQIYSRCLLSREPGVQVIWNALNTLPMNPGMNLSIQGLEYRTLRVLHTHHLVVKSEG